MVFTLNISYNRCVKNIYIYISSRHLKIMQYRDSQRKLKLFKWRTGPQLRLKWTTRWIIYNLVTGNEKLTFSYYEVRRLDGFALSSTMKIDEESEFLVIIDQNSLCESSPFCFDEIATKLQDIDMELFYSEA